MHSNRMRTARSSSRQGVSTHPWSRHPPEQAPPRKAPSWPDPPQLLPYVWAWTRPLNSPLGVDLETPPSQIPLNPPWVWAWKPAKHAGIPPPGDLLQGMLGYHLQCMLGNPPPPGRILDTCYSKYYLAGGNETIVLKCIYQSSIQLVRMVSVHGIVLLCVNLVLGNRSMIEFQQE